VQPGKDGRNLVGDDLRRVEMAGVETEQLLPRDRVAQVKLMRADDVRLRPDAEQFGLHRVAVVVRIDGFSEDGVEGLDQARTRSLAIDRRVLVAVGNPEIGNARRAECLADGRADLPADDAMIDPEAAN